MKNFEMKIKKIDDRVYFETKHGKLTLEDNISKYSVSANNKKAIKRYIKKFFR